MSALSSTKIEAEPDEHVFIHLVTEGSPAVSLDVSNRHGRRSLSVRVNGMNIGGMLLDVAELPPTPGAPIRFCPYCGEERSLFLSVDRHDCEDPR